MSEEDNLVEMSETAKVSEHAQEPRKVLDKLEIVPDTVKPAPEAKPTPETAPETKYATKPVIHVKQPEHVVSNEEIKVSVDRPYLTCQEHVLAGTPICENLYKSNPHKPVGVIDGLLKVEDAAQQRAEQGRMAAQGRFFGHPGCDVQVSLEALTINGLTKKDPVLLNEKFEPINTSYSEDFPYRRGV